MTLFSNGKSFILRVNPTFAANLLEMQKSAEISKGVSKILPEIEKTKKAKENSSTKVKTKIRRKLFCYKTSCN